MSFRETLALNAAPLLLRMALAATFVWAGSSKVFFDDPVTGEDAAALANLGVIAPPSGVAPAMDPPVTVPAPASAEDGQPASNAGAGADGPDASGGVTFTLPTPPTQAPSLRYSAEQFPQEISVSRRHTSITLTLYNAARPDENGRQLWPAALATPGALRTLAWVAPLAELVGGFLVLLGFLTRVWAVALAGAMMGAMLLTTVGPAALSSNPFLGFLPQPRLADSGAWVEAWTPTLFQFTLLMSALALACTGAGALSFDRLVFGSRSDAAAASSHHDEDAEDDD